MLNFSKRYEDDICVNFGSVSKVALRFGCAKQSKNLKRYLVSNKPYVKKTPKQFENDFEFFHLDIPNLSLGMGLRHLYIHKIEIYLYLFNIGSIFSPGIA